MEKSKFIENRGKTYIHKGYAHRGWHHPNKKKIAQRLANEVKNGTIVEIGVFGGASILSIIDICIENSNKIVGIDPWELAVPKDRESNKLSKVRFRPENLIDAYENLKMICKELKYDNVQLIKEYSHKAVDEIDDKSIDLLYVDGEHTYHAVLLDLNLWLPKMKEGATIWGDDFNTPGVKRAVVEFCNKKNLKFVEENNSFIIRL